MTGHWTDRQMKLTDFCDCAIEFLRRNYRPFIPVMLIYSAGMAGFSYFITAIFNLESLQEITDSGSVILRQLGQGILALVFYAIAAIVAQVAVGMFVYYTYTKLMTGKDPERKYMLKRGIIYALFNFLLTLLLTHAGQFAVSILTVVSDIGLSFLSDSPDVFLIPLIPLGLAAIYIYIRLSLAAPLMVVRNRNIFVCLGESWKFTKKKTFRIILLMIIISVLSKEAATVIGTVTAIGILQSSVALKILSALATGISSCTSFLEPVVIVFYIVYEDTRNGILDEEYRLNAFLTERESDVT